MVECGRLNGWDAGHKSDFLMPNPHLLTGFTHQIESYETGCCFMGYMCCFSLGIIIPQIQNDLCSVSYVAIAVYDAGTSYFFRIFATPKPPPMNRCQPYRPVHPLRGCGPHTKTPSATDMHPLTGMAFRTESPQFLPLPIFCSLVTNHRSLPTLNHYSNSPFSILHSQLE